MCDLARIDSHSEGTFLVGFQLAGGIVPGRGGSGRRGHPAVTRVQAAAVNAPAKAARRTYGCKSSPLPIGRGLPMCKEAGWIEPPVAIAASVPLVAVVTVYSPGWLKSTAT